MAPNAELPTSWPAIAGKGSMVQCVRVEASIDELFHTTWIAHELPEAHHKARADKNFRVTPWVATKAALETCEWHDPEDPALSKPALATNRFRKVRFDSAPSAFASQPFENQEMIQCNTYSPGKQYVLEAITSTNAPYGDKFKLFIRYTLTAESRSRCTLLITHHVEWDPSMNFMLKPMVSKGVDVGLRAAFKTYRQLLGEIHTCTDISEQDWEASRKAALATGFSHTAEEEEGAEEELQAEAAATEPEEAAAAQGGEAAGRYAPHAILHPPNLLSFLSEQLVYRDQVPLLADVIGAGMRSITDQGLVARILAVVLTLSLVSAAVTVMRAIQRLCAVGGPLLWPVCFPLTRLIDLPDSTSEVLTAVALVALVNYGIMKASELSVAYLNQSGVSSQAAGAQPAHDHAAPAAHIHAHASPSPSTGVPPSGTVTSPGATSKPAAPAASAAATATSAAAKNAAAPAGGSKGTSAPAAGEGSATAAAASKGAAPSTQKPAAAGGKPPKAGEAPGSAGAGAQKHGKPPPAPVVVTKSNNVSPLRGAKDSGPTAARGQPDSITSPPALTQPPCVEMEMQCLSPTEGKGPLAGRPSTAGASSGAAAAGPSSGSGAGAGDVQKLMRKSTNVTAVTGSGSNTPAAAPSRPGSGTGGGSGSQGGAKPMAGAGAGARGARVSDDVHSPVSASPTGEERSWLDSMADTFKGAWQKSQEPFMSFIASGAEPAEYGMMAVASSPNLELDMHGSGLHKSKSTTFVGESGAATPATSSSGAATMNRAAVAAPAAAAAATTAAAPAGTVTAPSSPPVLSRRSATGESAALSSASFQHLVMGDQELPDEEPDVVVEEVYENERFQPFRLWGHTWPGHFLPSDRVGHWSDKMGAPYGPASMEFDQVAPKLPNDGWRWLDEKWTIDMDGFNADAVDADGWYYALDFNYLKRHPAITGPTPLVGSGKCSTHHFVRRRRWVRRRSRIGIDGSSSLPVPQAFTKDSEPGGGSSGRSSHDQRMLRSSADDVFKSAAAAAALATNAAAAAAALNGGAASMPCSPTQPAPLAPSSPSVPLVASALLPTLLPPSNGPMDREQGSAASSLGGAPTAPPGAASTAANAPAAVSSGDARVTMEAKGLPEVQQPSQGAVAPSGGAQGAAKAAAAAAPIAAAAAGDAAAAGAAGARPPSNNSHAQDASAPANTAALMAAAAVTATAAAVKASSQPPLPTAGAAQTAAPQQAVTAQPSSAVARAQPDALGEQHKAPQQQGKQGDETAAALAEAAAALAQALASPLPADARSAADLVTDGSLRTLSMSAGLQSALDAVGEEGWSFAGSDADFTFQRPSGGAASTGNSGAPGHSVDGAAPAQTAAPAQAAAPAHPAAGSAGVRAVQEQPAKAGAGAATAPKVEPARVENEKDGPSLQAEASKDGSIEDPLGLALL